MRQSTLHIPFAFAIVGCLLSSSSTRAEFAELEIGGFGQPIECNLGSECFVMKYFDTDSGPGEVDSFCGRQTTDGHNGTDFAIPHLLTLAKSIPVVAIQAGTVLHVRDGIPDEPLMDEPLAVEPLIDELVIGEAEQPAVIGGDGCGNGLVIDHGEGWTSLYCHLKKDSLVVDSGTQVEKGMQLGLVGSSGGAGYPHVHLTISYYGEPVDPFVGPTSTPDCMAEHQPLWDDSVSSNRPPGLVEAGFAKEIPTRMEVWRGLHSKTELSPRDLLVMWIHAFGVVAGDKYHIRVRSPEGEEIVSVTSIVEESARDWLSYAGIVGSSGFLPSGVWQGEFELTRDGATILSTTSNVTIRAVMRGLDDNAPGHGSPAP